MNKLSIQSVFSNKNTQIKIGKLDIKSLFQQTEENVEHHCDPNELLIGAKEKQNKLKKYYNNMFKKCWETIIFANKNGLTEITYEIPKFSEISGYNCKYCILFLCTKLREQKMDTKILNQLEIYISWKNFINNNIKNNDI